jgi:hypothetical protein
MSLSATFLLACNDFEIIGALLFNRILLRNLAPTATTVRGQFLRSANAGGINDAFVSELAAAHELLGEVTRLDGIG